MNELGEQDVAAQIEYIHKVKTGELLPEEKRGQSSSGGAATAGEQKGTLPPTTMPCESGHGKGCARGDMPTLGQGQG